MFSSKENKTTTKDTSVSERNRIAMKTTFKGDLNSEGDFRIDGRVEGNLTTTGKVIIGQEGEILGDLKCSAADVEGSLTGKLEVKGSLTLRATAVVNGDAIMGSLQVENGATFNANCKMLSSVKELNPSSIESAKGNEKQNISKVS